MLTIFAHFRTIFQLSSNLEVTSLAPIQSLRNIFTLLHHSYKREMLDDTDNPAEAGIFQEVERKKKKADQRALSNEHIHEKFCRI